MSMTILYGENQVASRQALMELLQTLRAQGREVTLVSAAGLQLPELEQLLGTDSLFAVPRTLVLEGLHSLPLGGRRTQLLKMVSDFARAQSTAHPPADLQLILWEKRALTATMLKLFPTAKTTEFKVSSAVFNWLDSLSPKPATLPRQLTLLQAAVQAEDAFMCFAMLARHLRMMITAQSGGKIAGPPFIQSKIRSQAQPYSLPQLVTLHRQLLQLDWSLKLGKDTLPLAKQLELWCITATSKN